MPHLVGSLSEQNLLAAIAGEAYASLRYTWFAEVAARDGHPQVAAAFLETAANEREHARRFTALLGDEPGDAEITTTLVYGQGGTAANLRAAMLGEEDEHGRLYFDAARTADDEGFTATATAFRAIAREEYEHEKRFRALLALIERHC